MQRPNRVPRQTSSNVRPARAVLRGLSFLTALSLLLCFLIPGARADRKAPATQPAGFDYAANVVVPQTGVVHMVTTSAVALESVDADVRFHPGAATTTLTLKVHNAGAAADQAELLIPVPPGAVPHGLTLDGEAAARETQVLPREEAVELFRSFVMRGRDPAILEFSTWSLLRTAVFPVGAGQTRTVTVAWDEAQRPAANRMDYVLPRTEAVGRSGPKWTIHVRVDDSVPVATVHSPSHPVDFTRGLKGGGEVAVRPAPGSEDLAPGPFRLSLLMENNRPLASSVWLYPDGDGGMFAVLAAMPPAAVRADGTSPARDLVLVMDVSGSMQGEKIVQAIAGASSVVQGLRDGEHLSLISYSDDVHVWRKEPLSLDPANRGEATAHVAALAADGSTNLHGALDAALRMEPRAGSVPIVLFLTDGLPTAGDTSESAIVGLAEKSNPFHRRVYTFGVGVDVNAPLLENVAAASRGAATFILPGEPVDRAVREVFRRLDGPVFLDPVLSAADALGAAKPDRIRQTYPAPLPDGYAEEHLLIFGRYSGKAPFALQLSGEFLGQRARFDFAVDPAQASMDNTWVARLWATRRIAELTAQIRKMGADLPEPSAVLAAPGVAPPPNVAAAPPVAALTPTTPPFAPGTHFPAPPVDPRIKPLVDEIVELSITWGILTEYTAFLADEGTDLRDEAKVMEWANDNFSSRAMSVRTGAGAVNQSMNQASMSTQGYANSANTYYDADLNLRTVTNVQQTGNTAAYRRNNRWVPASLARTIAPDAKLRRVAFGTEEWWKLANTLTHNQQGVLFGLQADPVVQTPDGPVLLELPTSTPPAPAP